jgi:hypothetical protein
MQIFNEIEQALGRAASVQRDKAQGQVSLFGALDGEIPATVIKRTKQEKAEEPRRPFIRHKQSPRQRIPRRPQWPG